MASRHPLSPVVRVVALILVVVGVGMVLAAILADPLGIGGGGEGFGWKQLILAIFGLVVVLIGVAWLIRPPLTSPTRNGRTTDESR